MSDQSSDSIPKKQGQTKANKKSNPKKEDKKTEKQTEFKENNIRKLVNSTGQSKEIVERIYKIVNNYRQSYEILQVINDILKESEPQANPKESNSHKKLNKQQNSKKKSSNQDNDPEYSDSEKIISDEETSPNVKPKQPKKIKSENKKVISPKPTKKKSKDNDNQSNEIPIITTNNNDNNDNDDEEYEENIIQKKKSKNPKKQDKKAQRNRKQKEAKLQNEIQRITSKKCNKIETVKFSTNIELDMHGGDPHIKEPLDWAPIIRDVLLSAFEEKVDKVIFITGRGKHSDERGPVLRPIVLLTSKRIGFECCISKKNPGKVEVEISSYKEPKPSQEENQNENENEEEEEDNTELYTTFNVYNDDIKAKDFDEKYRVNKVKKSKRENYSTIRKMYPDMPSMCISIICEIGERRKIDAVKFAESFEDKIQSEKPKNIDSLKSDEGQELIKELKRVNKFLKLYGFDREVIEKVIFEKKKPNKIREVFDRIVDEVPLDFYNELTDIVVAYQHLTIDAILDAIIANKYDFKNVVDFLNSKSAVSARNALGVMRVNNVIKSKREKGNRPKYIPSIKINLKNAGKIKAERSIERILFGIDNGAFAQISLVYDENGNHCNKEEIEPFVLKKAKENGLNIKKVNAQRENVSKFVITQK